ncbi:MAG: YbjN domain-containing protein [Segniliparus sp.]|uniref:YbjN domain-containing protein n=1 Tax=Segniliparus sp. TaxID=2804064 RepID=UPI003F36CB5F
MSEADGTRERLRDSLRELEIDAEEIEEHRVFWVVLPAERRHQVGVALAPRDGGVRVEAFVCRAPEENHEDVFRFLLQRNQGLYGVHYTIDKPGDVYLIGYIPKAALGADELDRVLGQIVLAVDSDFNQLLSLGFAEAIRREWQWRTSRGESTKNLAAFTHLLDESGA